MGVYWAMNNHEVWREVEGYEGRYEVSNFGRIRSLDRVINTPVATRTHKGRVLKGGYDKNGYVRVTISDKDLNKKAVKLHVLVARAFVEGESDERKYVIFIDDDKKNITPHNLKWATQEEVSAKGGTTANKNFKKGADKHECK